MIDEYKFHQSVFQRKFIVFLIIAIVLFLVYLFGLYLPLFNSDIKVPFMIFAVTVCIFWVYFSYRNMRYYTIVFKEISKHEAALFESESYVELILLTRNATFKSLHVISIAQFVMSMMALMKWVLLLIYTLYSHVSFKHMNLSLLILIMIPIFSYVVYLIGKEFFVDKGKSNH